MSSMSSSRFMGYLSAAAVAAIALVGPVAPASAATLADPTINPADETNNVALNANIVLTFAEGKTITSATATLTNLNTNLAHAVSMGLSSNVVTIDPTTDLADCTPYRLQFAVGSVTDSATPADTWPATATSYNFLTSGCTSLDGNDVYTYTTEPVATPKAVGETLSFSACVSSELVVYNGGANGNITAVTNLRAGSIAWAGVVSSQGVTNNCLSFTTTVASTDVSAVPLKLVSLSLANGAFIVRKGSTARRSLVSGATLTLATGNQNVGSGGSGLNVNAKPVLLAQGTLPSNAATGVKRDQSITLQFNEQIRLVATKVINLRADSTSNSQYDDGDTVLEAFTIPTYVNAGTGTNTTNNEYHPTSNETRISVSNGGALVLNPNSDLAANTKYYVEIPNDAITDTTAGTALLYSGLNTSGALTYSFTTAADGASAWLAGPSVYQVQTAKANGNYKVGEAAFNVTLKWSSPVSLDVGSTVALRLNVATGGAVTASCTLTDSTTLNCPYTVASGHNSNNAGSTYFTANARRLNVASATPLVVTGGTGFKGTGTGTPSASLTVPTYGTYSLGDGHNIVIDTTAPVVRGGNPPFADSFMQGPPVVGRNANFLMFFDGSETLSFGTNKNLYVKAVTGDATLETINTEALTGRATIAANRVTINPDAILVGPDKAVSSATRSGNIVTYTSTAHGFVAPRTITSGGGNDPSYGANTVTLNVGAGHGLIVNDRVQVTGLVGADSAATAAVNGLKTVTAVGGSTISYAVTGVSAAPTVKPTLTPTGAAYASNAVTLTVPTDHGVLVNDVVVVSGLVGSVAGETNTVNGLKTVTAVTATTISYGVSGVVGSPTLSGPSVVRSWVGDNIFVTNAGSMLSTNGCVPFRVDANTFTCSVVIAGAANGSTTLSPAAAAGRQPETNYYITFDAGFVKDPAGNDVVALTAPTSVSPPTVGKWVFRSSVDTFPPFRVNTMATTSQIVVDFNESLTEVADCSSCTPTLTPSSGTLTVAVSGTSVTITPSTALTAGTSYTLLIPAARVTDGAGNTPSADVTTTFTIPVSGGGGGEPGGGAPGGGPVGPTIPSGGGGPASCGPPPLPPCNVGPGINFGPGGMIQNPGAVGGGDMANLRPDNFMGFRPDDARNLGTGAMQNFRPDQFGALPPTAMAGFNRDQISNLNPAAMAGMNQTQFRALPPEAMGGFRPDQMAQLPPEAMGAFDPTRVQALPPSAMAGFNANQFAQLPPAAMAGFDPTRMQQLPPAAMAGFNANQMQQLPPAAMAGFDASKMAQLPPSAMAGFDPTKMQQLPPAAMAGFNANQMQQLPPAAFTAFDPSKMQQLPPQAMAGFDATRLAQLPPAAVTGFKPDQFAQLPPSAMAAFDPTKMQQLPPAAVAGFQPEQMRALPPEAMRVFDPSKMQQLPPAAMAGFDPTKMQALPPTAMAVMNPGQLGQLPPAAFGAIQPQQFNVLPPTAMQGFKPELMAAMPPQMMQNFKPAQFAELPPAAMGGLDQDRFRALPPQAMTAFNPQQMGAVPPQAMEAMRVTQFNVIPPAAMQGFKPDQFAALPPDAMQAFKPAQMAALPPQALAGMEPGQLRVLPPEAARALNPQQMPNLPPQALAAIPPGVFKALTPQAIAALTPEQRSAMPPQAFNPPPLGQPATAANIGNLVNNLSGWNIDKVPPAAFGGMRPTDVAKLPPDAFSAMNPNQVGALPPAAFTGMKPNQVEFLPPEAMAAMKPTQFGQMPPAAMAALSPAQFGALPPSAMTQMKPTQLGQLPPEAFEVMKPTQMGQLPPAAFTGMKPTQIDSLPPEAMSAMKPTQLSALPPAAVSALDPSQVAALPPAALTQMKPTQVAALPAEAVAELKPTQVAALPPAAVGGLKPDQMAALPPESMTAMKPKQVAEIKPVAMAALTSEQAQAVPARALGGVKPAQLGALSTDAVASLSTTQLNALPSTALSGLSAAAINSLLPERAATLLNPPDLAQMRPAQRDAVRARAGGVAPQS